MARPDEEFMRSSVLVSLTGDLNPHYAVWGHLFHYLYVCVAGAWLFARLLLGHAASWSAAVAEAHCDPWSVIWLGRAVSAAAGSLTVLITYRLARSTLRSRAVALGAAILLAATFLHVRDSHFATADILLGLVATVAIGSAARSVTGDQSQRVRAGVLTGLALATKLLAVTVILAFVTVGLLEQWRRPDRSWWSWIRGAALYVSVAGLTTLVLQPFLALDPMETWFGLFDDLFNSQRRPFSRGIDLANASVIVRYYVPQATGWTCGGLAAVGLVHMMFQHGSPRRLALVAFTVWWLLAVVSVQTMFLRYLTPLTPVLCVMASHGISRVVRVLLRFARPPDKCLSLLGGRFGVAVAASIAASLPNMVRDVQLGRILSCPDTRALAGRWIELNVPSGSRIVWTGYEVIPAEVTMPWLEAPLEHAEQIVRLREARGLPTAVEQAVVALKRRRQRSGYRLVSVRFSPDSRETTTLEAFPPNTPLYDLELLRWWEGQTQRWLVRESPRWELTRRQVTNVLLISTEHLVNGDEEYIVTTGMPCDRRLLGLLSKRYDEVARFDAGVDWSEQTRQVMYDLGDRWYVPNWGIARVDRPGPEIRIWRKRPISPKDSA